MVSVVSLCLIDPILNVSFLSSFNVLGACVDRAVPIALCIPFNAICTCIFSANACLKCFTFQTTKKIFHRLARFFSHSINVHTYRFVLMKFGLKRILKLINGAWLIIMVHLFKPQPSIAIQVPCECGKCLLVVYARTYFVLVKAS